MLVFCKHVENWYFLGLAKKNRVKRGQEGFHAREIAKYLFPVRNKTQSVFMQFAKHSYAFVWVVHGNVGTF